MSAKITCSVNSLGLVGPKTGSNRAQNTANKNKVLGLSGFFNIIMGFLGDFNYSKMAN